MEHILKKLAACGIVPVVVLDDVKDAVPTARALLAGGVGTSMMFGGVKYDTTTADGKALFATDHPSKTKAGYVQSNIFKAADGFSVAAMDKMEEAMQSFCDDDGHLL